MSRSTLDALELRGATLVRAEYARIGDRVCFLNERFDYVIEDADTTATGTIRHHHGDYSASSSYDPGEWIYVIRK